MGIVFLLLSRASFLLEGQARARGKPQMKFISNFPGKEAGSVPEVALCHTTLAIAEGRCVGCLCVGIEGLDWNMCVCKYVYTYIPRYILHIYLVSVLVP